MLKIITIIIIVHIINEVRLFRYIAQYTGVTPVTARGDYSGVITIIIAREIKHAILHDIKVSTKLTARVPFKKLHFL